MTAATSLGLIGGLGVGELLVIGVVALLVFGRRLPDVARSLGKGLGEFKKGLSGMEAPVRVASSESTPNSLPAPLDAQPDLPDDEAAGASPSAPPHPSSESPSSEDPGDGPA